MSTIARQLAMTVGSPLRQQNASLLFDQQQASDTDTPTIFNLARNGLTELIKEHSIFSHFTSTLFREIPPFNFDVELYKLDLKSFLYLVAPIILRKDVHKCLEFLIRAYKIHTYSWSIEIIVTAMLPYSTTALFPRVLNLCDFTQTPALTFFTRLRSTHTGVPRSTIALATRNDINLLTFLTTSSFNLCSLEHIQKQINKSNIKGSPTTFTTTISSNVLASFITLLLIDLIAIHDTNNTQLPNHIVKLLLSFISKCLSAQTSISSTVTTSNLSIGAYMVLTHLCGTTRLEYNVLTTMLSLVLPSVPFDASPRTLMYPLLCLVSLLKSQRLVLLDKSLINTGKKSQTTLGTMVNATTVGNNKSIDTSDKNSSTTLLKGEIVDHSYDSYIIMLPLDIIRSLVRMKHLREAITLLYNAKGYDISQFIAALLVGLAKYLIIPTTGEVINDVDSNKHSKQTNLVVNVPFFELLLHLCENTSHTSIIDSNCMTALLGTVLNCFSKALLTMKLVNPGQTVNGSSAINMSHEMTLLLSKYLQLFFHTINYHHPELLQSSIQDLFHVLQIHPRKSKNEAAFSMNDSPISDDSKGANKNKRQQSQPIRGGGYFLDFLHKTSYDVLIYVLSVGLQCTKHQLLISSQSSSAFTITQALSQSDDHTVKIQALAQLDDVIIGLQRELFMYCSPTHATPAHVTINQQNQTTTTSSSTTLTEFDDELAFLDQGIFASSEPSMESKNIVDTTELSPTMGEYLSITTPLSPEQQKQQEIAKMPQTAVARHVKQTQSILNDSINLLLNLVLTETNLTVITSVFKMSFWKQFAHHFDANLAPEEQYSAMSKIFSGLCLFLEKILSVFGLDTSEDSIAPFHSALQFASDLRQNSQDTKVKTQIAHSDAQVHKVFFVRRCTEQLLFSCLISLLPLLSILHHQFPQQQQPHLADQLPAHTAQLIPYFFMILALPQQSVINRLIDSNEPIVKSIDLQHTRLALTINCCDVYSTILDCCGFLSGQTLAVPYFAPSVIVAVATPQDKKSSKKVSKKQSVAVELKQIVEKVENVESDLIVNSLNNIAMFSNFFQAKDDIISIIQRLEEIFKSIFTTLQPFSNTNTVLPADQLQSLRSLYVNYNAVANELNLTILPKHLATSIINSSTTQACMVSSLVRLVVSPFIPYLNPTHITPLLTSTSFIALSTIHNIFIITKAANNPLDPTTVISFANNLIQFSRCCIANIFTPSLVQETTNIYEILAPFFISILQQLPNPKATTTSFSYSTWSNAVSDTLASFLAAPSAYNIPVLCTLDSSRVIATQNENCFDYEYSHAYLISTLYMIAVGSHQQSFLSLLEPVFSHVPGKCDDATTTTTTAPGKKASKKVATLSSPSHISIALLLPVIAFPANSVETYDESYPQRLTDWSSAALHIFGLQLKTHVSKLSEAQPLCSPDFDVAIVSLLSLAFQPTTPTQIKTAISKTLSVFLTSVKKNAFITAQSVPVLSTLVEIVNNFELTPNQINFKDATAFTFAHGQFISASLNKAQPHLQAIVDLGCFDAKDQLKLTPDSKLKLFHTLKTIPFSSSLMNIATGYLHFIAQVLASSGKSKIYSLFQQQFAIFCEFLTSFQPFFATTPDSAPIASSFTNFIAPSSTFSHSQRHCYNISRNSFTTTFSQLITALLSSSDKANIDSTFLLTLLNNPLILPQQSYHFFTKDLQYQTALFSQIVLKFLLSDQTLFDPSTSASKRAHQQLIFDSLLPLLNSDVKQSTLSVFTTDDTSAALLPIQIAVKSFINKHSSYLHNISTAAESQNIITSTTTVGTDITIDLGTTAGKFAQSFSKYQAIAWFPSQPNLVIQLLTAFTIPASLFNNHLCKSSNPTHNSTLGLLASCLQHQYRCNTLVTSSITSQSGPNSHLSISQIQSMKERVIVSQPWTLIPLLTNSLGKTTSFLTTFVQQYITRIEQQQQLITKQVTETRRQRQQNSVTAFATHDDQNGDYYDFMFEQELLIQYQHETHALLTYIQTLYANQFQLIDAIYYIILTSNSLLKTAPKSIKYSLVEIHEYITPHLVSLLVDILLQNTATPQVNDIISMVHEYRELDSVVKQHNKENVPSVVDQTRSSNLVQKSRYEIQSHFGLVNSDSKSMDDDEDDDDGNSSVRRPLLRYNQHQQHQLAALHTLNSRVLTRESISQIFSILVDHTITSKLDQAGTKIDNAISAMVLPIYQSFQSILHSFMATLSFAEYNLRVKTIGSGTKTSAINYNPALIPYQQFSVFHSASGSQSTAIGLQHIIHNSPLDIFLRLLRSVFIPLIMLRSKMALASQMDSPKQHIGMLSCAHILQVVYGYHEFLNLDTLFIITISALQHASQYYIHLFIENQLSSCPSRTNNLLTNKSTMGKDQNMDDDSDVDTHGLLSESDIHTLLAQQIQQRTEGLSKEANMEFPLTKNVTVYDEPLDITSSQLQLHEQLIPDFITSAIVLAISTASTTSFIFNSARNPAQQLTTVEMNSAVQSHSLTHLVPLILNVISPQQQILALQLFNHYACIFPHFISTTTDFTVLTQHLQRSTLDDGTSVEINENLDDTDIFTEDDVKFSHRYGSSTPTAIQSPSLHLVKAYTLDQQLSMSSYNPISFSSTCELLMKHQSDVKSASFTKDGNQDKPAANFAAFNIQQTLINVLHSFVESKSFTKSASEASSGLSSLGKGTKDKSEQKEAYESYLEDYQDAVLSYMVLHTYLQHQTKRIKTLSSHANAQVNLYGKTLVQALNIADDHITSLGTTIGSILTILGKQLTTIGFTKLFKNIFTQLSLLSSNSSGVITTSLTQFKNPTLLHHIYSIQPLQTILASPHLSKGGANSKTNLSACLDSFTESNVVPVNLIYQRLLSMFIQRLTFERQVLYAESFVILLGQEDTELDAQTYSRAQAIIQSELSETYTMAHNQYYRARSDSSFPHSDQDNFDLDSTDFDNVKSYKKGSKGAISRRDKWILGLKTRQTALLDMIPWLINNIVTPSLTPEFRSQIATVTKSNSHWTQPIPLPATAQSPSLEHLQISLLSLDELVGLAFSLFFPLDDPSAILKTMVFNHDHHRLSEMQRNEAFSLQLSSVPPDSAAILLTTTHVLFITVQNAASQAFNSISDKSEPVSKLGSSRALSTKKQKVVTSPATASVSTSVASPAVRRQWLAILCSALMCSSTLLQRLQMIAIALVNKFTSFNLSILLKTIHILHHFQSPSALAQPTSSFVVLPPDQVSMAQLSALSFLHTLILVFGNMLQPFHLPIVFVLCHPGTVIVQSESADSATGDQSSLNVVKYSTNETALRSASLYIAATSTSYDEYDQEGDHQLVALGDTSSFSGKNSFVSHSTSSILSSCIATFAVNTNPQLLLALLLNIHSIITGLGPIAINRVLTFANHLISKISNIYGQARGRQSDDDKAEDLAEIEDTLALEDYDIEEHYPSILQLVLTILDSRTMKGGLEIVTEVDESVAQINEHDLEDDEDDEDENPFTSDVEDADLEGKEWNPFEEKQSRSRQIMHDQSDNDDEEDFDDQDAEEESKRTDGFLHEQQQLSISIQETGRVESYQRSQLGTDNSRHTWAVSLEQVLLATTALTSSSQASYQLQWTEFELSLIESDAISILNDVVLMLDEEQLETLVVSLSQWVGISSFPDIINSAHKGPKSLIYNYNTFDDSQEAHRQNSITHLQRQIHNRLSRFVVFVKVCHHLLHSTRHLFIPMFLEHCAGYLIATLSPLNGDIYKQLILRKKSQQENKCFKHKQLTIDLNADGLSAKSITLGNTTSGTFDSQYQQSSGNDKKRKLVSPSHALTSSSSTITVVTTVATELLLHTTWHSQCIAYFVDILRVMLLIDISYVQTSAVEQPSQYGKHSSKPLHRKNQSNRSNTSTSMPTLPSTIVVKSLFRELLPKPFVEQSVILILAQLQHGHKLRQFLPIALVPQIITDATAPVPCGSSGDLAYLTRQKHFLVLGIPVIKSESLQTRATLPYTLVQSGNETPLFKSHKNLLVFSSYVEQLLVPTINTLCEYLHSTQPLLWENITSLLSTGCHSKYLQIRFASLSAFHSLLQPQLCVQALITSRGGIKAGQLQTSTHQPKNRYNNSNKDHAKTQDQPQWSNEFFHACVSLFVPTIAEMMQDPSAHIQRLSQTVVRLTESIGGESFSKYLR